MAELANFGSVMFNYVCDSFRHPKMDPKDEEPVKGKVVLITGSNSGIGKEAAIAMAQRGAHVIMACRDMEKARNVLDQIKTMFPEAQIDLYELDLGDLDSVRNCANKIRENYNEINILVNNAGIIDTNNEIKKTKDGFELHMGINYLGQFLFTILLLNLVKTSTTNRIVFTGSTMHQLAKLELDDLMNEKRGHFAARNYGLYGNSKLASMYFALGLSERLEESGVNVYVFCPGYVNTDAFRHEYLSSSIVTRIGLFFGGLTPKQGCETLLFCSLSKKVANETGNMYRFNKIWPNTMKKLDKEFGTKLWLVSETLVGLNK